MRCHTCGLGSSPVARHYWGNHCCFLLLEVLRCFSSLRSPPQILLWGCRPFRPAGCPIRKSPDQRLFAPTRCLSQLITSFIASVSQGIRHAPSFVSYDCVPSMPATPERVPWLGAARSPILSAVFCDLSFKVFLIYSLACVNMSKIYNVENNGFEPLTPCLQSRCSSQLS